MKQTDTVWQRMIAVHMEATAIIQKEGAEWDLFVLLTMGYVLGGGEGGKDFVSYDLHWAFPKLQSQLSLKGRVTGLFFWRLHMMGDIRLTSCQATVSSQIEAWDESRA